MDTQGQSSRNLMDTDNSLDQRASVEFHTQITA